MKNIIIVVVLISSLGASMSSSAGHRLFVGGLAFATTSAEVNRLVMNYGTVLSISVKSIDDNGDTTAKANVEFESEESVDDAVAALDGMIYMGEPLVARKKAREIVVVGSKVKEVIRGAGLRSDGELVQALSDDVHKIIRGGVRRAKSNKRGTVRPYDL